MGISVWDALRNAKSRIQIMPQIVLSWIQFHHVHIRVHLHSAQNAMIISMIDPLLLIYRSVTHVLPIAWLVGIEPALKLLTHTSIPPIQIYSSMEDYVTRFRVQLEVQIK